MAKPNRLMDFLIHMSHRVEPHWMLLLRTCFCSTLS